MSIKNKKEKKEKIQDMMLDLLELELTFLQKRLLQEGVSHQELEVLRKLLLDNNVNAKVERNDSGTYSIVEDLPFEVDDKFRN